MSRSSVFWDNHEAIKIFLQAFLVKSKRFFTFIAAAMINSNTY